ncbi:MAG: hypothetical protein P8H98_12755 [Flavobacteriales bacterium]|nr:hypothetical protein [Flavobacteriales bacterium]
MSKRIAVIDCGTNTFNLLIADLEEGNWKTVFNTKQAVKLGQGGFSKEGIRKERYLVGMDALKSHRETILNYQVDDTFAFATSALREAGNGQRFVKEAAERFGIHIKLIDGDREAALIMKGVRQSLDLKGETALIMDIGGGSTEFIIANDTQLFWKESFPLGVSRLYEQLQPQDPIEEEEVLSLKKHLSEVLLTLDQAVKEHSPVFLLGSSGSFDSIVDMAYFKWGGERNPLSNPVSMDHFNSLFDELIGSTKNERLLVPGLQPIRADFMVIALIMIKFTLERYNLNRIHQSNYALKEGVLFELAQKAAETE